MIDILFSNKLFKYDDFIFNNLKYLKLNPTDAIVLKYLLDEYGIVKTIDASKIEKKTGISKKDVEESLSKLLENGFYDFKPDSYNGKHIDTYTIEPFFDVVVKFFNEKKLSMLDLVINFLESNIVIPFKDKDYELIKKLVLENGYELKDFKLSVENLKEKNINITISNIIKYFSTIAIKKTEGIDRDSERFLAFFGLQ